MFDFGMRLRELRERAHLSQEQLGKKIGRSKSVISTYENNVNTPTLDVLIQFAVLYNVSLDYLVGIDKEEMASLSGLTSRQRDLIQTILLEFRDPYRAGGLSSRQQDILNTLMIEFVSSKK